MKPDPSRRGMGHWCVWNPVPANPNIRRSQASSVSGRVPLDTNSYNNTVHYLRIRGITVVATDGHVGAFGGS